MAHGLLLMHMQVTKNLWVYNNSCNVRHHVGLPVGKPAMTRTVKRQYEIYEQEFGYLHPSKHSLC